jgi:carbon storage regulator
LHIHSIANKGKAVSKGQFETLTGLETHKDRGARIYKQGAGDPLNLTPRKGVCMLILTRRVGEKLIIGENVTVTMLSVKGNQIRIGIDAPRDITVNREEIFQRILSERKGLSSDRQRETPLTLIPAKANRA